MRGRRLAGIAPTRKGTSKAGEAQLREVMEAPAAARSSAYPLASSKSPWPAASSAAAPSGALESALRLGGLFPREPSSGATRAAVKSSPAKAPSAAKKEQSDDDDDCDA